MPSFLGLIIIAIIGGAAVTMQAQMIGLMDQRLGSIESVFITYGSGAIFISLAMAALRGGNLNAWPNVPWYAFGAGVLGLVIIGTIGYSVSRLGLVTAFTIIVASQFIIGAFFDHFGLLGATIRPLDLSRLAGVAILLIGVWLIVR